MRRCRRDVLPLVWVEEEIERPGGWEEEMEKSAGKTGEAYVQWGKTQRQVREEKRLMATGYTGV